MYTDIHSWLDVGLQTLKETGWRPGCPQPHTKTIERAIPPDESEAHFCTDRVYSRPEHWAVYQGTRVAAPLLEMFARSVTIDETVATIALLIANERVLTGRGFVQGRALPEQMPMYINEMALLHAPRVQTTWMGTVD